MMSHSDSGIIDQRSQHSVEQMVERLTAVLHAKGVTLFALVDHSAEAAKVGMNLPLKILVWEDAQGRAWLSYNSPAYLGERHGVPQALLPNITVVETLARAAGE